MKKIVLVLLMLCSFVYGTVTNITDRVSAVGSNTVGQTIPYTFPTSATTDLIVKSRVTATGVETLLTLNTDYSATASTTGGNVIMITPIAATSEIHVIRNTPRTQTLSLTGVGATYINNQFDKVAKQNIEDTVRDRRAIHLPDTDSFIDMNLPDSNSRANKGLGFDSSGKLYLGAFTTWEINDVSVTTYMKTILSTITSNANFQDTIGLLDEDNFATNSADYPPSQQSTKAYVDAKVLSITGSTITSPKISDPNITGTVVGSATYTTPTLTSPIMNTGVSGTAISHDTLGTSTTTIPDENSVKVYVDTATVNIAEVNFTSTLIVNNQTIPVTWTDLNLSSGIGGARSALVYVKILVDASPTDIRFRRNGDTEGLGYSAASIYGGGVTTATLTAGNIAYLWLLTDSSGVVEVDADAGSKYSLWVLSYIAEK